MSPLQTPAERHRAWLELVDTEGPFLALPVVKRVWPQGMPKLEGEQRAVLSSAKGRFEESYDAFAESTTDRERDAYRVERTAWVEAVLGDVAGWAEGFTRVVPPGPRGTRRVTVHGIALEATAALVKNASPAMLVVEIDPVTTLRDLTPGEWSSSPIDRMESLLRATGVPIGLVTDGRWWALVSAPPEQMSASGVVDSQTWIENADVRDAFLGLLSRVRLVGGSENDRLPSLFVESITAAEEITVALGTQVRRAVELLVTGFSDAALDVIDQGRADPLPLSRGEVYEAAVTIMMRIVFLLFAEERSLLPQGLLFAGAYGVAGELDVLDSRAREEGEESLDATYLSWHRLLATSQALYRGSNIEDMRLHSYGGSLFDPERFPFLTKRDERGVLALAISDRVMFEVFRAIQRATIKGESRRISFRTIDVEQIGYIYEGLLGYASEAVDEVVLGLIGTAGEEPELPLVEIERMRATYSEDAAFVRVVLARIAETQPAAKPVSAATFAKALRAGPGRVDAERAMLAVTRDGELISRLRPFIGIIRRDLRDRPTVVQPGGLLVVETPSRATSGAHYTPKSLAREVVEHALEPLVFSPGPYQTNDRDAWLPLTSDQLLQLKVADIACGSGAFLVASAEYLAERLVEAWSREGTMPEPPENPRTLALRKVVARCLYGADINAMAIEMCKLSLWLVSLDPKLPFSFVDDKVLHGNSLLGLTSERQLRSLSLDDRSARSLATASLDEAMLSRVTTLDVFGALDPLTLALERAVQLRQDLASEVDDADPQRSTTTKRRLLEEYRKATAAQSEIADAIIAAGLPLGGKPGRALNLAYENLREVVAEAYPDGGEGNPSRLHALISQGLAPIVATDYQLWKPLHWILVVPEVLERGGFDAIVGNPPFLGGKKLTGVLGTNVRDWFVNVLADGARGSADLVAYFFLRAHSLIRRGGTVGLIATNSIAQGESREVGLDRMVKDGFQIMRAIQSRSWPAASANLEFAAVWGTSGEVPDQIVRISDAVAVGRITTLLEAAGRTDGWPERLPENTGLAMVGCYVLGTGFIIDAEEAACWIEDDPKNSEVLFPYLNGEDLNSRPDATPSRWVIDFYDRSQEAAATYRLPFERVRERVLPERQKVNRKANRERWWQYAEKRPGLRRAIAPLGYVVGVARVSKSVMPLRVPTGIVPSEQVVVFATDSYIDLAVLSSGLHQTWVITYGSTLETRVRYSPSDVFDTYPRPEGTPRLLSIGKALDAERNEIMLRRGLGVTKLYNLVNDPTKSSSADSDIDRLREIHRELDEAVIEAYGWNDVELNHGFYIYRQMERWTFDPAARVELMDRLLAENLLRAASQGDVVRVEDDVDEADGEDAE